MKSLISFLLICLSVSIAKGQEIMPNLELAGNNTYLKLINRYKSNKVIPFWLNDRNSFIYAITDENKNVAIHLVENGKKKKIKLDSAISKTSDYTYSFTYKSKKYSFNSVTNQISDDFVQPKISNPEEKSPDQKYSVVVIEHNLYISLFDHNKTMQLSNDGETFYSFKANVDYNFTNELLINDSLPQSPNISWSPNSDFFVAFRTDARILQDNWVINSISEPRPTITTYKQRNPGEPSAKNEVWIYNVSDREFVLVNLKKWEYENYWFLGWSQDGKNCFIQRINREQNKCDILSLDKNGTYKILIEENPDANVYPKEFRELPGDYYLWFSRRDGWGHLYLYDSEGNVSQLTKGEYTVDKVLNVDTRLNKIYLLANGREFGVNPYYSLLYSVDFQTKEIKLLTPENANHEIYFSPDRRSFVDIISRADLPHKSQLRSSEGDLIMELENANITRLIDNKWRNPEIFTVKAADSVTNLWGVMWKPFDFDTTKKYPIISYVYPGPQDNFVPVEFFSELNNVHLAQYGFIVVMCETRGSSYKRSKAFSEYYRTNLRDYPVDDNKYMIEQLAKKYSFIDLSNVGIWGGSSGGFMAATAILKYPDFYKVSVSRAGQHDPRVFHAWWSDLFNTPISTNEADTIYTNLSLAPNLKGKLFLIHGEMDTNVHPSNSARLVNELMKAGKYFDYLVVPGGGHGWSQNWQYVQMRIWLYFIENLMNYTRENVDIL
ncbi:MAG: DPP IV N-terminal domain-containing protein [Bacteroidales bacterium]|nr:MAG: DPP IV N-terminal domain-containing protein [Bacteroidales bacterium]